MSERYLKVIKTSTSRKRKRIGDDIFSLQCHDCVKYCLITTTTIDVNLDRQHKNYWCFESLISAKIGAFMFHDIQTDENQFRTAFFNKLMAEKAWT